jgi:hypothetical protein
MFNNYVLIYAGAVVVLLFSILPPLFITEPRELEPEASAADTASDDQAGREDSFLRMLIAIRPLWGFLVYDIYAMGRRMAGIEPANYYAEIACAVVTIILVIQALLERDRGEPGSLTSFRKVIAAHSFSWVGIQTTFVFLFAFLQQQMPQITNLELGRVGSMSFLVLNAVGALLPALILMPMAHRIGRIKTHVICLAFMTAGYLGLYWFGAGPIQIYLLMAVVGIGWAAMVSLPFAIVSQKVSQARMGLYMGLFNLSVVLPQLVVSLGVALIISRAPDKNIIFAISAASLALSTIAWGFVPEDR